MIYFFRFSLPRLVCCSLLVVGALALVGCFGSFAHKLADKEAYPIIADKQKEALGKAEPGFSIDSTKSDLTQKIDADASSVQVDDASLTAGLKLDLSDALELAVDNSREYQTRKEGVYLQALALTEARHEFDPIFSGELTGKLERDPAPVGGIVERFGTATSDFAVNQLLPTGARITVGMSQAFSHFFSGAPRDSASGAVTASVTQPLLRGAGSTVVMENLKQSERDTIYQVRDFERYRRGFVIDQVRAYYRVLQALDGVANEYSAYQRLVLARERAEALLDADRLASFEVDQARQDEINARNRWLLARTDYVNQLDAYKVALGLSTRLNIMPDPAELESLRAKGLVEVKLDRGEAENRALAERMDYLTSRDRIEDARREIKIAENSLLPIFDFRADYGATDSGRNQPFDFQGRTRTYSGGLTFDLPFDRKLERNGYRRAEIDLQRAQRDADQLQNEIVQSVRLAYQAMVQAAQSYAIQSQSLELAARRVDNVRMLIETGRSGVTIRDQLEAESALRDAQNEMTRVLIDHLIARLQFYYAMESLQVDERGQWKEPANAEQ